MQSGSKNPPWARSNANTNMAGINPQIMDPNIGMGQQSMMPFQQSYNTNIMQNQGGMSMPMGGMNQMNQMPQGQMYNSNVVAYPTPRAMNSNIYSNSHSNHNQNNGEQRVFTGTVTKTHNDFGFVDHDVFYQTSVCTKGIIPKLNDRVLVEATYNANMPFKWNATRVQVLPKNSSGGMQSNKHTPIKNNSYNAVPPPNNKKPIPRRDDRPPRREEPVRIPRKRSRSRSPSREKRNIRPRRDSPVRKRSQQSTPAPVTKNFVRVPRIPLEIKELDVATLTLRYIYMYVPSDFFNARIRWGEVFPPQSPFSLNNSCSFHIKYKDVDNPVPNDAVLEPPDADYRFSAKVMLLSMPTLESLYQKCGLTKGDDKDRSSSKTAMHPTRLIKFLVGYKEGSGDNFAIGGPWSPSLDGENPQSDPQVLVKTAIRTCKALTGIDLSSCTQWYRMVEFNYWRESNSGRSRPECVVLYVADANSVVPRDDWPRVSQLYADARDAALHRLRATDDADAADPVDKSNIDQDTSSSLNESTITIEDNDAEDLDKTEMTHYSKLDMKTIKVDELRRELKARNVSTKGLRPQLLSRLSKLLKNEEEKEKKSEESMEVIDDEEEKKVSEEDKTKEDLEQAKPKEQSDSKEEKATDKKESDNKDEFNKNQDKELANKEKLIKSRYELPATPHIIVHPNRTAKAGKFNCHLASLSLLLDYRLTDNKEHSFELFVFAEIFNEMLMRDFGFYIYKTLYTLPAKTDEIEKSKEKSEVDEEAKKDDLKDKNEEQKEKKDDIKDKKEESKDKKDDKKEEVKENKDDLKDKKDDLKDKKDEPKDKDRKDDRDRRDDKDRKDDRRDERRDLRKKEQTTVDLPPDPYLLLSLVYFDTARCGHVIRKDLQTLFLGLGLRLARSQVIPLLDRVCYKDCFYYTNLVQTIKDLSTGSSEVLQDLSIVGSTLISEVPEHITELEAAIAAGNRNLLPVFDMDKPTAGITSTPQVEDDGMVFYNGRVIRVGALTTALTRSEASRARLETSASEARAAARTARAAAAAASAAARSAAAKAQSESDRLARAKRRADALEATVKIFHNTIKAIMTKADAVVNIKYEDDDVVEVNGTTKDDNEKTNPSQCKEEDKILEDTIDLDEAELKSEDNSEDKTDQTKHDVEENMDLEDKE